MKQYLSKEEQKQADDNFRSACSIYYSPIASEVEVEKAWDKMFSLVYQASEAAVKMKLKNVKVSDDRLQDLIVDTTCNVCKMLHKKKDLKESFILENKLVSLCSPYSLYPLYAKQQKFEENITSLDSYIEEKGEYASWKKV